MTASHHQAARVRRKILFFPMSSVTGHLTRTLALAEELDAEGHEAHVAMGPGPGYLEGLLPPGIRTVPTLEIPGFSGDAFGRIADLSGEGPASDRRNLRASGSISASDRRHLGKWMTRLAKDDLAIVEKVDPDAIVTDYRFTLPRLEPRYRERLFHISHVVGFPSLHRRVTGSLPYPLDRGHVLVPGVEKLEYWRRRPPADDADRRETLCGLFRWQGWKRLRAKAPEPPRSDVLLFFGSTGNAGRVVPHLLRRIPARYRVSCLAPGLAGAAARGDAHHSEPGDLESCLHKTDLLFCHGGHGTVMEAILQQTPIVVLPCNVEQLEIGRRIEKMRLGLLIRRPHTELSASDLNEIILTVRGDARIAANLKKYSALLRRNADGAKTALSVVLRSLGR